MILPPTLMVRLPPFRMLVLLKLVPAETVTFLLLEPADAARNDKSTCGDRGLRIAEVGTIAQAGSVQIAIESVEHGVGGSTLNGEDWSHGPATYNCVQKVITRSTDLPLQIGDRDVATI